MGGRSMVSKYRSLVKKESTAVKLKASDYVATAHVHGHKHGDVPRTRSRAWVRSRDGRISAPAIRIRPDFHYPAKSVSGRIARFTPDRIGANYY